MSEAGWIEAISTDELPDNDVVSVTVAGRDIALYSVEGEVFATDNSCTHGQARLSDGFLEGCVIECPLHQGKFDVRDGRPVCAPVIVPLARHAVKIEGSRVYIRILAGGAFAPPETARNA
jgi:naphthalene 1,2-dioxygenase system ferredoxin subunit